jgi:hypothetical protein
MLITRRLQEWACLLGTDLSFPLAHRLLGWQAGEAQLLCPKEVQRLVLQHGRLLRAAAAQEVQEWLPHPEREQQLPHLVPVTAPRRKAAWPRELEAVVAAALAVEDPTPPEGVTPADWERVLAVRRAAREEPPLSVLRRLGPELGAAQLLACADEVLVRQPEKQRFAELRTARVVTKEGERYLCGTGWLFVQQLWLLLLLCGAQHRAVTFLADGARWLREFAQQFLVPLPRCELLLDWFHLAKKVRDRISRMGGSKATKETLRQVVLGALWRGDLDGALEQLAAARATAPNPGALQELESYLRERQALLPHYRERRAQQQYIGSGLVEKTNDLLVARRQKNRGMHWNLETSEALARLKMLQLNHEWDAYWAEGQLPHLVAA